MKLSTQPYKGTRDFFPEDLAIQKLMFNAMKKICERYGYVEYDGPLIEKTDLFRAKSGEEIVNEQTYTFTDRGNRDVTLRPEMTPTVARMIARNRQELAFPVRWYSIPNCFRYENPQRGRLREFWQLNVDFFGKDLFQYDVENIQTAAAILLELGAKKSDFNILVNSRTLMNAFYKKLELTQEQSHSLSKLIDRKNKMSSDKFETAIEEIVKDKKTAVMTFLNAKNMAEIKDNFGEMEGLNRLEQTINKLKENGFSNTLFTPEIMRGFDYYTGVVFELFDTDPKNPRAIAGGGRYDDLVGLFDVERVGGIGYGMGDVVLRDFLDIRGLLPKYTSTTQVYLCALSENELNTLDTIAEEFRKSGISVATIYEIQKVPKHIKRAEKSGIENFVCIGEDEVKNKKYTLKNLTERKEKTGFIKDIVKILQS
ncbi:MAG: histidine--tRNA ligase [Alphaproteobacteria bacterium]|nr:histidine--tRNA ligase [Alphaproteobacteria bacterium]MBN2779898.1 histidine--tRNA ligase [Alphaproteobacteria bacterium]